MRWLLGSVPDWNVLFEEAFKATKPGGWVQSYEPMSSYTSDHVEVKGDSPLGQWGRIFAEGGKKIGRTFQVVENDLQVKAMEAAGFVDIQEWTYKV